MNILYLGTHPVTGEATTVKVLSPKYVSQPEVVKRFLKEAEIIALADHPNIVRLYGHGEWEGGLYIAMEFIQGISLRSYLLQNPLSLRRALEIILDIAYALCHLHTHGVIHRDLKPENILIAENGAVKVIDFGIAQLLQEHTVIEAEGPGLIGTPIYMSPEQRDQPGAVGYPSDIYSLGIISYELILGRLCLGQVHLSLMPKGLQKILARALQPNPSDRYRDIVDFITDVSAYLHSNALEKEKPAGDQLSELAEQLKQAYTVLLPPPPLWPQMECGIVVHRVGQQTAGFYDFLRTADGGYVVLCGVSAVGGMKSLLYTAVVRGMAKALHNSYPGDPKRFLTALNIQLAKDQMNELAAIAYLILYPSENRCQYISYSYGALMHLGKKSTLFKVLLPTHSTFLGSDTEHVCHIVEQRWESGDTLLWWGQAPSAVEEGSTMAYLPFWNTSTWAEPFLSRSHTPMQKQLENAYRRAKVQSGASWTQHSLHLIGLYRRQ